MKVYKKCSCCGKIMFLLLGSDFGNEIEFGSTFGSKDNLPHPETNHEEDWKALINFLTNLKKSHGEIFISLKAKERDSFPKEILTWTENYQAKEAEKPKKEKQEKILNDEPEMKRDWRNIHLDFNYQGQSWETNYQAKWENLGFTYNQTKAWIDIGMKPSDSNFCAWLRDKKNLTSELMLNYGKVAELRKEFNSDPTVLD